MVKRCFDAVLFDLGDTLMYFDARDNWPDVFSQARQELLRSLRNSGYDLAQDFVDHFYQRMSEYYLERDVGFIEYTVEFVLINALIDRGYTDVPKDVLTRALAEMHVITQAHWIPEPDALDTLAQLYASGYKLALISNASDDPNTQVLVDKLGARQYFNVIASSAAFGIRKPNPRIFLDVLKRMHVLPEKAVMVGDTLGADILGAHHAGIFSIWKVGRVDNPTYRLNTENIVPDLQIQTLSELPELLDRLAQGWFEAPVTD